MNMKRYLLPFAICGALYACSEKTASTVTKTTTTVAEVKERTESATVTHEMFLAGKTIYDAKCGRCHKLHQPSRGDMTHWDKWLDRMAPKAKLTAEEKEQVRNFISVNAKTN